MVTTIVSGERQRIDFISVLNPDCTSAGYVTVRIITPPVHGELTTERGLEYTSYPKNNQRYQCNEENLPSPTSIINQLWDMSVKTLRPLNGRLQL